MGGESILAFNAVVWLVLVAVLVHAVVKYRAWVRSFWEHPARTCFFSLIPATTAQVGASLYPYAEAPALTFGNAGGGRSAVFCDSPHCWNLAWWVCSRGCFSGAVSADCGHEFCDGYSHGVRGLA